MKIDVEVNGFAYAAEYRDEDVDNVLIPLLNDWREPREKACGERVVVLLAAPPGAGKTTLSLFLEQLGRMMSNMPRVQALGMDGFHYPNSYLETHVFFDGDGACRLLKERKGAEFTFDVSALAASIGNLKTATPQPWPAYSRVMHDVVPAAIEVTGDIVLVEGNYLLLDAPGWRDLAQMGDRTIFLGADEDLLHDRLVERKVKGGMDRACAETWYEASDGLNVRRVLKDRLPADIELALTAAGGIKRQGVR